MTNHDLDLHDEMPPLPLPTEEELVGLAMSSGPLAAPASDAIPLAVYLRHEAGLLPLVYAGPDVQGAPALAGPGRPDSRCDVPADRGVRAVQYFRAGRTGLTGGDANW